MSDAAPTPWRTRLRTWLTDPPRSRRITIIWIWITGTALNLITGTALNSTGHHVPVAPIVGTLNYVIVALLVLLLLLLGAAAVSGRRRRRRVHRIAIGDTVVLRRHGWLRTGRVQIATVETVSGNFGTSRIVVSCITEHPVTASENISKPGL